MHKASPATTASPGSANRDAKYSLWVFLLVGVLLLLIHGNRFALTNDEGILLEPAQRLAEGARPYVDFFGYMSPGSYWIQAALFRLLGTSLWVGRLPVIAGLSLQSALVFWLVARLASRRAAAAVFVFVGFQIADPAFLTAQHRWDSATLALAGLCCAIGPANRLDSRRFSWGMVASGALLALAAWCTPSVGLVACAEAIWLLMSRERRRLLPPLLAGAGAVTLAAAGALWMTGTFAAFVNQMLWLTQNYATVNVMPYGSVIGGYGRLFEGSAGIEAPVRVLFVLCLALPAILPPLAAVLWCVLTLRQDVAMKGDSSGTAESSTNRKQEALLLVAGMAAFVVSTFPRADLMHLAFIGALPYALVAAGLARLLPARGGAILAFTVMPFALLFSLNGFAASWNARSISTPVGTVRADADVAPELQKFVSAIHPGEGLFVYPYMPVLYFVTQARNPTRFAFLAPGMMTRMEESAALAELSARPPEWLMYMRLTREEYLRVFPNATGLNHSFEAMEAWIQANYRLEQPSRVNIGGYRLWKRAVSTTGS